METAGIMDATRSLGIKVYGQLDSHRRFRHNYYTGQKLCKAQIRSDQRA